LAGLNLGRLCEAVRSPPRPRTARHPVGTLPRQQVRLDHSERPGECASPDPGYSRNRHMHRPPRSPETVGSSPRRQPQAARRTETVRTEPGRTPPLARPRPSCRRSTRPGAPPASSCATSTR